MKRDGEHRILKRMKRLELIEMIYALRKSNVELEQKCDQLQRIVDSYAAGLPAGAAGGADLARMEQMIEGIYWDLVLKSSESIAREETGGGRRK